VIRAPLATSMAVAQRLTELGTVVQSIDDVTFTTVRADGTSGSIGAHVRHTLDHVAALVDTGPGGIVDYDTRRRDTDVERERWAAISELTRLACRLHTLPFEAAQEVVQVSAVIERSGRRVLTRSTLGRELVFVLSHTVHHQAIIALLLASSGQRTPDRFGVAPSTPLLRPCAQSA
jgi:hypothetical protein